MLKIILKNLLVISFISLATFLSLALASFSSDDPSFIRSVNTDIISNFAGLPGAYLAGPLIYMFGITNLLLVFFLYYESFNIFKKRNITFIPVRFSIILSTIITLSFVLSFIESIFAIKCNVGGVLGKFLLSEITTTNYRIWCFLASLIFSIFGIVICFNLRIANFSSANNFVKRMIKLFKTSLYKFYNLFKDESNNPVAIENNESEFDFRDQSNLTKDLVSTTLPLINESKNKIIESSKSVPISAINPTHVFLGGKFNLPSTNLLKTIEKSKNISPNEEALVSNSKFLQKVLEDFGIVGQITKIHPGPVVTLYEFDPVAGTKSSRVVGLSDDIARSMSATSARIAIIPGKTSLGIELPNAIREMVSLKEILESAAYINNNEKLPLILGKSIAGEPIIADLAKMPHLLVAGTTGSGKSVAINTMILSLLFKHPPDKCKFIMIDPKMLELSIYDNIPHLLAPVVTESKKAVSALKWVVKEMENRYRLMSLAGVRNLEGYNDLIAEAKRTGQKLQKQVQVGFNPDDGKPKFETIDIDENHLPFIVVIVDEMADLMIVAGKEIESSIQRLAQMARAAGIHIIMATQRPSVDVITGVIKANFPTRISFQVTSKIDSRTILGEQGADQLLGMGDMLFMRGGGRIERAHGPFISDLEVKKITDHLRAQGGPQYDENVTINDEESNGGGFEEILSASDDLYQEAVDIVLKERKASTSYIQRCLRIGYNRAANIIERMEKEKIVSAPNHVGKREVLQE